MKNIFIVCVAILFGCRSMSKESKRVYRSSKEIRKNKIERSYIRIHGAAGSIIHLRAFNTFDRLNKVYMFSVYYSGTYTISDSVIIFKYTNGYKPREFSQAYITDTTLTLSYVMKYKKEDYIGKDGRVLNGVDTTLWSRVDTIKNIYKIIK